jgi:hypothetical protein
MTEHNTFAQAMEREGVFQIRYHRFLRHFTVQLESGQIGGGKTIRAAIDDAKTDAKGKVA